MRAIGPLIAYLCIATIIAQVIIGGYAFSKGYLSADKMNRIVAVASGAQLADEVDLQPSKPSDSREQLSFEEIEMQRGIKARHLELREQAIKRALEQVKFEQRRLLDEKQEYERLKAAFETHLAQLSDGAVASGRENVRLIWENVRPKQAKEQILQMVAAGEQEEVVAILSAMPIAKRAKIVSEFKTEEETKQFDELLRLIRKGLPETAVIDEADDDLQAFEAKQPSK